MKEKNIEKIFLVVLFSIGIACLIAIFIGLFLLNSSENLPKNCAYYEIEIKCGEVNSTIECFLSNRICDGEKSLDTNQSGFWNITHHYLFGGYDRGYVENYFKEINPNWNISYEI